MGEKFTGYIFTFRVEGRDGIIEDRGLCIARLSVFGRRLSLHQEHAFNPK